jgi:hypothetical protein
MKLSKAQLAIVAQMQQGASLSNNWESEGAPYRPIDGLHSGHFHAANYQYTKTVRCATINALLRAGMIHEHHRVTTHPMQGERTWQSDTIYYELTEKGRALRVQTQLGEVR